MTPKFDRLIEADQDPSAVNLPRLAYELKQAADPEIWTVAVQNHGDSTNRMAWPPEMRMVDVESPWRGSIVRMWRQWPNIEATFHFQEFMERWFLFVFIFEDSELVGNPGQFDLSVDQVTDPETGQSRDVGYQEHGTAMIDQQKLSHHVNAIVPHLDSLT